MDQLKRIYNDPKDTGSFGGVERLLGSARRQGLKVNRDKVKAYLKGDDSYTLHKPARRHFTRNKIIVNDIDKQWQADLAEMQDVAKDNDGVRYLLTVIDCFSKYAWVVTLKKKDTSTVVDGFKRLFTLTTRRPVNLHTDKGKEFMNSPMQDLFREYGIHHFTTNSDMKAAMVERFNRTLKTRIFTYFTSKGSNRYIDDLQHLVDGYNKSVHRTIGMRPIDVRASHVPAIFAKVYGKFLSSGKHKPLNRNTSVRVNKIKKTFEKGYLPNWTREKFEIDETIKKAGKTVYKLKDRLGEEIEGTFYPEEIQVVDKEGTLFRVEKILKTRTVNKRKEHLIKWLGYPDKFNSWIKASQLRNG
jgi:transposase InsO family protein